MESKARQEIRRKLDLFISSVPAYPQEIISGSPILPVGQMDMPSFMIGVSKYASALLNNSTDPTFFKCTQARHIDLLTNWHLAGTRTTCNDFCCHAGFAMGAKFNLGQFTIQALLEGMGKGHAWVPATSGAVPQYGDIFRAQAMHMGVSLEVVSGGWWTVESGQGGPGKGCDILKRKIGFFNPTSLRGWVDMEVYLDDRPAVPDWLLGAWIVYDGSIPYTYIFDKYYNVSYAPGQISGAGFVAMETVGFQLTGIDSVSIAWMGGTLETFRRGGGAGGLAGMTGMSTPPYGFPSPLRGVKM